MIERPVLKMNHTIVSPPEDTHVSHKARFRRGPLMLLLCLTLMGCGNRAISLPDNQLHDRLLDLLVTDSLPLDHDGDTPVIAPLGSWIRKSLAQTPRERFQFTATGIGSVGEHHNFEVNQNIKDQLIRLNDFYRRNTAVAKTVFAPEAIEKGFRHPATVADVKDLIKQADANTYSETGGLAAIDANTQQIHFLPVTSLNEIYARKLTRDRDWNRLLPILKSAGKEIPFLPVRTQRLIDTLQRDSGEDEKNRVFDSYMDLFLFYSRYSYVGRHGYKFGEIARHGLPGYYLGLFHVHPADNTPSPEDRMESILRKNLVIIPRTGGFEVQYLFYGAQPDAEPQIISVRDDS